MECFAPGSAQWEDFLFHFPSKQTVKSAIILQQYTSIMLGPLFLATLHEAKRWKLREGWHCSKTDTSKSLAQFVFHVLLWPSTVNTKFISPFFF